MNKIGFIGLGTMGAPIAMNLLNAGYELYFYPRREPVVQQFRAAGAIPVGNGAWVAEAADVIIAIGQQIERSDKAWFLTPESSPAVVRASSWLT